MFNCGIYKIENECNKKVYIGSSHNLYYREYLHFYNLKNNLHKNNYLQKSFNKYGKENFKFQIIKHIEKIEDKELLKEELLKWENYYLKEYMINDKIDSSKCYNLRIIAESNLGVKFGHLSYEHRLKISISGKGKKRSKETIENMSIAQRRIYHPIPKFHRGSKHKEESKVEISNFRLGRAQTGKERNETEVKGITMSQIDFCVKEALDSYIEGCSKYFDDHTDYSGIDTDVVARNATINVEKAMGIYPNIAGLY